MPRLIFELSERDAEFIKLWMGRRSVYLAKMQREPHNHTPKAREYIEMMSGVEELIAETLAGAKYRWEYRDDAFERE